jgi:response regulator RpfG family c-di-GMP phosphodiesterase
MQRSDHDPGVSLAELLAAFSLATDLGLGQPMEHVLRSWQIAESLGSHMGIDARQRESLFYVAMLAWVGCVAVSDHLGVGRAAAARR